MTRALTADDDRFHAAPTTDPMWTETTWWGFAAPDRPLGGMVYALFRPNLGVAALVTQIWDADAVEPWAAPYARSLWHLPLPAGDLDDTEVGPLRLRCLDPLTAYELRYDDGVLALDLDYRAVTSPHVVAADPAVGHFDQLCHVTGRLRAGGHTVDVDVHALRDRSWYVRDDRRTLRSGYTYGAADADHHFLAYSRPSGPDADECDVNGGYLVRDGVKSNLASGTRRVTNRRRGHPDEVEITAIDDDGRTLTAHGHVTASLASQSTPGMFAWMSIAAWDIDGRPGHGEDHDVTSPDLLARLATDAASRR
jgi:hypothetical protein